MLRINVTLTMPGFYKMNKVTKIHFFGLKLCHNEDFLPSLKQFAPLYIAISPGISSKPVSYTHLTLPTKAYV